MKVDHDNEAHEDDEPIQVVMDFEEDAEEMKIESCLTKDEEAAWSPLFPSGLRSNAGNLAALLWRQGSGAFLAADLTAPNLPCSLRFRLNLSRRHLHDELGHLVGITGSF